MNPLVEGAFLAEEILEASAADERWLTFLISCASMA